MTEEVSNVEKAAQVLFGEGFEGGSRDACTEAAQALADAGLLIPEVAAVGKSEEWVLICGEGQDEDLYDIYATRSAANEAWTSIRENIASGEWEAEDYEPVKIYHRTLTTFVSEWEQVDE